MCTIHSPNKVHWCTRNCSSLILAVVQCGCHLTLLPHSLYFVFLYPCTFLVMSNIPQSVIPISSFYGRNSKIRVPVGCKTEGESLMGKVPKAYPFKCLDPESPSSVWKVFRKQDDAILYAKKRMNGVMTFVCQSDPDGERCFVVAHPRLFWFYDCQKEKRCSYEIICEHSLSKLYFDLEFCKETNPGKNGVHMTDIFIKIVSLFLHKEWGIECTRDNILDLDSSTDVKFSRHLIYQLPSIFKNNYHVGNFVKMVRYAMQCVLDGKQEFKEYGVAKEDVSELLVDDKGKQNFFYDECVYSKNRHFRLYCSSKWNKNVYLVRSEENKWLSNCAEDDEKLFLDSLITCISANTNISILQFSGNTSVCSARHKITNKPKVLCTSEHSQFPEVSNFIRHLVAPGRVYRCKYVSLQNCIYFDIVGNRYCQNIGREHRSNNIRFVVNVKDKIFYQKCYDPDCRNFQSEPIMLPEEVLFSLEGPIPLEYMNSDDSMWKGTVSEDDLEILDCLESSVDLL